MHTFMVACVDRGNAQQLVSAELVFLSMRVEQGHRKKKCTMERVYRYRYM